jgi:hypothetical protein
MRKLLMAVVLTLMLSNTALAAIGYQPDELLHRRWTFTPNMLEVYASPMEYIQFGPETIAYFDPPRAGIVGWKWLVGPNHMYLFLFVAPIWLYDEPAARLWIQSGEDKLGLDFYVVLTR